MSLSLSALAQSVFVQGLGALDGLLDKAAAYAGEHKIDEAVLLQDRLFPTMLPFVFQVRTACDFAKGTVCRLAGQDIPKIADDETSFAALRERVARTLDIVRHAAGGTPEGTVGQEITIGSGQNTRRFAGGEDYLLTFALPNFYFHLTTAYDLLRHNGVTVGKRDFLGAVRTL